MEGQADDVAGCHEIGLSVDVGADVVGRLCDEEWEELFDGFGERQGC